MSLKIQTLQIIQCEEATYFANWISFPVQKPDFFSIGEKDKRINPIFLKNQISIIRCLTLTHQRIATTTLSLYNSDRFAISSF